MLLTVLFWYVSFITFVGFVSDIIKSQTKLEKQGQKIGAVIGTTLRFVSVYLFLYLVYQSGII